MPGRAETSRTRETPAKVSAEQVAAFLAENPGFLAEHPDLLASQAAPHRALGSGIADLQGFLIERLRAAVRRLEEREREWIRERRALRSLTQQAHKAALAMIAAQDLNSLVEVVTTDLAVLLDVDAAVLAVECDDGATRRDVAGVRCVPPGTIDAALGAGCAVKSVADGRGDARVFGAAAGLARSAVLARLGGARGLPPAVLAVGSRRPNRLPGGTGALRFLAEVLEQCLRTRLGLPL
jgi:uncharacterized protein YigA (DUF484 family)